MHSTAPIGANQACFFLDLAGHEAEHRASYAHEKNFELSDCQ